MNENTANVIIKGMKYATILGIAYLTFTPRAVKVTEVIVENKRQD